MSLSEQSQQWYPTSVQVTVLQARNLRVKGKNGTNDAFAVIQVAKDKFSTSVAEKSVAPVWKEEASFDLPLFHRSNADRCKLYVIVMHRALGGLDKLLGQAVINLVDLHEDQARKKTDWYKLVDKGGKTDKDRGEVLLDIQFTRNSMTASMFDLSLQDKPRSRLSKIKDKVRGKKKDVDSASAVVPASVNQVLTDSEGEEDDNPGSLRNKKSSKFKSLFGSKTNLNKGISQSMNTLGTLPEKNSTLSSSRTSGLNEESAEGKSKFKFLGHKRNGSTDSKVSLGPFSLLNRNKQSTPDPNNVCINGNHVYSKEQDPNSGSSLSLNDSAKGSVEDLRNNHGRNASTSSVDSFMGFGIPSYKPEPVERSLRPQEDVRRQELQDDQERKKQQEQEERPRKLEDEEKKIKEELQRKFHEEEQLRKKREEEARKAEELKRQEESRVTERLTNLFGFGKKKDEPSPPAVESPKHLDIPASSNPFEEISLSPENTNLSLNESPDEPWKEKGTSFTPTPPISSFPARTAKVSAVKPRPHPVKPLSLIDSLSPGGIYMGNDFKTPTIREVAEKSKAVDSGPYTQLTQDELITLVVKQQVELSKKDEKIGELEEYIDNLLVRVMEEKPNILSTLIFKC
ncbi:rab11 family-interacting protein 1 [Trichomycterus rosablanca]|uniref:rab11 family-interacting protein 1 n=1 Tax=Trichomycterus rosablanca TaxID=2290929 RepID=UPI002F354515